MHLFQRHNKHFYFQFFLLSIYNKNMPIHKTNKSINILMKKIKFPPVQHFA